MKSLLVVVAAFALSGCGALLRPVFAPPATVEKKLLGTPRAAVPVAGVRVFSTPQELPPGSSSSSGSGPGSFRRAVGPPTGPRRRRRTQVIAAFAWTGGAYGELPDVC
ncbi:MAG: hypothetical protein R3F43_23045 [bacterium]